MVTLVIASAARPRSEILRLCVTVHLVEVYSFSGKLGVASSLCQAQARLRDGAGNMRWYDVLNLTASQSAAKRACLEVMSVYLSV